MEDFSECPEFLGQYGYIFEPEKESSSENDHSHSDSEDSLDEYKEIPEVNMREGRSKMAAPVWCHCGNCVTQKTDEECFCCHEHELALETISDENILCLTQKDGLDSYVAHTPSLEMLFVDCMIRRFVKASPTGAVKLVIFSLFRAVSFA